MQVSKSLLLLLVIAMTEGIGSEEKFSWEDDDSWGFPVLVNSAEIPQENLDNKTKEEDAPPLPPIPPRKRKAASSDHEKGKGVARKVGVESDHEMHILTERERRKKMKDMFDTLHSLLPQLPAKADKSTIVDEAVNYIKSLELTLEALQKKKMAMASAGSLFAPPKVAMSREAFLAEQGGGSASSSTAIYNANPLAHKPQFPPIFQTFTSPNVVLNTLGLDGQFSICAPKKPSLFTAISYVLEKYKLQVVSAHVSSDENRAMYMIHTHASSGASEQFPEGFPVEEMYKQAAADMMHWINY